MARQRVTLRDQIMASAQAAMSKGSEHVALVAEIERNSKKHHEEQSAPEATSSQGNPAGQSGEATRQGNPAGQSGRTIQRHDSV